MITTWTAQRTPSARLLAGACAGALGGLAFLPVMLLLQPTLWARAAAAVAPGTAGTAAEFLGWLVHMAVLAAWGGLFAVLLPQREPRALAVGALGWAFLLAWFSAIAVTLVQGIALPALAWTLETLAHAAYGAVLAAALLLMARYGTQEETTP